MKRRLACATLACLSVVASASTPTVDVHALREHLLALPADGSVSTTVTLPVGDDAVSSFTVRDSHTLPRALMVRFPGLRSFRGVDASGRTLRLDVAPSGIRANIRDGTEARVLRLTGTDAAARAGHDRAAPPVASFARGGVATRHEFRLAVAASSRYVAAAGGTVASALAEIAHAVNQANEVFETDLGVHFTLVGRNDRIVRADPARDPFETHDPGPATVELIDREIGRSRYDIGQALTTYTGGDSHVGTSCSDARDADFFATHKAAAWSGHPDPTRPEAIDYLIHVLGRQLGAWPTADGCRRDTLDDRAMEPGGGSTAMGYAPWGCGGDDQRLQATAHRYFHAASIGQVQAWLASRGGRCATRRPQKVSSPWIDPAPLAEVAVVPARTPFALEAFAEPAAGDRRLTYAWEQMDPGKGQRGALRDGGDGPLFRSFPPRPHGRRTFPRMSAVLGREAAEPGETWPTTSRWLAFRLSVRDNGGDSATVASADTRVRVVDTGTPFALTLPAAGTVATAGRPLRVGWDVAGTTAAPISCHFLHVDLSTDGGDSWLDTPLASDVVNDGEAEVALPPALAPTERARLRLRCDWRPFFAVSPGDFSIR